MDCDIQGEYSHAAGRMCYGQYRRFLPTDHPWRTDEKFGVAELRDPPRVRTTEDMLVDGFIVDVLLIMFYIS